LSIDVCTSFVAEKLGVRGATEARGDTFQVSLREEGPCQRGPSGGGVGAGPRMRRENHKLKEGKRGRGQRSWKSNYTQTCRNNVR
jgi:hypothetical protein